MNGRLENSWKFQKQMKRFGHLCVSIMSWYLSDLSSGLSSVSESSGINQSFKQSEKSRKHENFEVLCLSINQKLWQGENMSQFDEFVGTKFLKITFSMFIDRFEDI